MANEITFKVKLTDDGGLKVVAQEAEKASKATDKLGKSTETLNRARNRHQKVEKGVGQTGLSTAKGFSKQAGAITGGLVPAYAVLAAHIFAITAAFNTLKNAAQVAILEEGFATLGNTVGRTSELMASRLKDITNGAISTEQALRSASAGFSAGMSTSEMEGLAKIAKGASIALGRDLGDALDRLIRGTAKLEPEILDELGLFIRLDDAAADYAVSLGKTAGQLTETERRQAFLNAALEQGERKFGAVQDIDTNPFNKLAASFKELSENILQFINVGVIPFMNILSNNTLALVGVLILFGNNVLQKMVPALHMMGEKQLEVAEAAKKAAPALKKVTREAIKTQEAAIKMAKVKTGKNTIFAQLQGKIGAGKGSSKEIQKSIESLNASIKKRQAHAKKTGVVVSAEYKKETQQLIELKAHYVELQALRRGASKKSAETALDIGAGGAEDQVSSTMTAIEQGGAMASIGVATEGFKKFREEINSTDEKTEKFTKGAGRLDKASIAIKKNFMIASGGLRIFGAALMKFIPFIGWAVFAIGLLVSAFKKLFGSTDKAKTPLQELDVVLETMPEKYEQLAKAIDKSNTRMAAAGTKSAEMVERGYQIGQSWGVANGVIMEVSDSYAKFSAELKKTDVGVLGILLGFFTRFMEHLRSLPNLLDEAGKKWASFTANVTNSAIWKTMVSVIQGSLQTASEAVDEVLDPQIDATKIANATGPFRDALQALIDQGGPAKKVMEDLFAERGAKDVQTFIDAIKNSTETVKVNGKELKGSERILYLYEQALRKAKEETGRMVEATEGFEKALVEQGKKTTAFFTNLNSKDKFQGLSNELVGLSEKIDTSITSLDKQGVKAEVLAKVWEDGGNWLEKYGITLEDLESKGGDALQPLIDAANRVVDVTANAKNQIQALNAALKNIKLDDKLEKTRRMNKQMTDTLIKTGKWETTISQDAKNIKADREAAMALAEGEFAIKVAIIELEKALLIEKINFQLQDKTLSKGQIDALQTQKDIIEAMSQLKVGAAERERDLALETADINAKSARTSLKDKALTEMGEASNQGQAALSFSRSAAAGAFSAATDALPDDATDDQKSIAKLTDSRSQLEGLKALTSDTMEQLKQLGPEGELIAAATEGAYAIGDAWMEAAISIKDSADGMEKGAAIAGAIATTIGQIGNIMAAASKARIAGVDREIEAEKKRDGKSKESLAKIKALEKKKEAMKRKAFEQNKKMQMAQVIANTAAAIMGLWSGIKDPYVGPALATAQMAVVGALGAAQLAVIAGTSYQGGGSVSQPSGPSSIAVGKRRESTDLAKSQSARGELAYFRGDQGIGGPENFRGAFYGKKHRAYGGNTGYIVGEQGPELFMPDRPGTIVPADDTAEMGAVSNVTFNINTIDASGVEEMLESQQGNIIGMLRAAANSYGEDFMESVDETAMISPTVPAEGSGGIGHRRRR